MPDKTMKIAVNLDIAQAAKAQDDLQRKFNEHLNSLNKSEKVMSSQLGKLYKQRDAWARVEIETKLTEEETKKLTKNMDAVNKSIKEIESPFEDLLRDSGIWGGMLIDHNKKLDRMIEGFKAAKQAGGFQKVLSDYLSNYNNKLKLVSQYTKDAFGGGITGFLNKAKAGYSQMVPVLANLGKTLLGFGPIAIGIGAALVGLWRAWRMNLGGMQTYFNRFVGQLRDMWHKFILGVDQLLRPLAPLFKVLLNVIFIPLSIILKVISGIFSVIFAILKPIFELIGAIWKPIADLFGKGNKEGNILKGILKAIGAAFDFIGKVVGTIIKIVLIPFWIIIKGITAAVKFIFGIFEGLGKVIKKAFDSPLLAPFRLALEGIKKAVEMVYKFLKGIWDFLGGIGKAVGGFWDWLTGGGKKAKQEQKGIKEETKGTYDVIQQIKAAPITTTTVSAPKTTNITTNANVDVHSSGAITPESAPMIGDVVASQIITKSRAV